VQEALAEAIARGITDGNGSQDLSGLDTAAKVVALANAAFGSELDLDGIAVSGIDTVGLEDVRAAARAGAAVRLLGRACRAGQDASVSAEVRPVRLEPGHPLVSVRGAEKAVTFTTDSMGSLTLVGGASDPAAAGAALLRDVLLLLRVGGRA
jgi:homoserine dehydrogenase